MPHFKQIFNAVISRSGDIESTVKTSFNEMFSCMKETADETREADQETNENAIKVINSLQTALSVLYTPTERDQLGNCVGDFLTSIANLKSPKPNPGDEKQESEIDLD